MKEINGIIYCVTNTVNGKQYVGQTTQSIMIRWYSHRALQNSKFGGALHRAIKKYGEKLFKLEQIDSASSLQELNEKESYWIAKLKTFSPDGYNLTSGGDGIEVSEKTKQKISLAGTGRRNTKETIQKMRFARLGYKASQETKDKLSFRVFSQETRDKMSAARKNRITKNETRRRLSSVNSHVSRDTLKEILINPDKTTTFLANKLGVSTSGVSMIRNGHIHKYVVAEIMNDMHINLFSA